MRSLSLPVPVALFIRRLFNVFSSITISNQYFLVQKTDTGSVREEGTRTDASGRAEGCLARSETTAAQQLTANSSTYTHWGRLKPWPWSTTFSQPAIPRATHATSITEVKDQDSFQEDRDFNEKSTPPSSPLPSNPKPPSSRANSNEPSTPIYTLMNNPTLFDPIRIPRNPIVLCHGLYGYDVRGPSSFPFLQLHYWANALKVLKKKIGAEVIVTGVPGTGSIESRAGRLDEYLRKTAHGRDINFVAHSMGGLDCRYLISHVQPREYNPTSLMTICTPHRGSPFMDWCKENIGLGKLQRQAKEAAQKASEATSSSSGFSLANLPSSITTFMLSVLDSPAYANLTTHYLQNVFNPATPDNPRVRYYSVAARTDSMSVIHPLWLPKTVLDGAEAREREACAHPDEIDWGNDGLVTVRSAKWGEFLGTLEGCDHWAVRGGGGLGFDAEWNVDLTLPSALKNSLSDPLSSVNINWKDWAGFIGAWRKADEQQQKERGSPSGSLSLEGVGDSAVDSRDAKENETEDAVLKSSTEKLSAVFDWISEQVASSRKPSDSSKPSSSSDLQISLSDSGRTVSRPPVSQQEVEKQRATAKASDAKDDRLKFDLERFYVALCRKLYDDGF